jgi:hypothetical protein
LVVNLKNFLLETGYRLKKIVGFASGTGLTRLHDQQLPEKNCPRHRAFQTSGTTDPLALTALPAAKVDQKIA